MGIFKKTLITIASLVLVLSAVGCSEESGMSNNEQQTKGVSRVSDSELTKADSNSPVIYEDTNIRLKSFSLTTNFKDDLLKWAEANNCLDADFVSEVEDGSGMALSDIGAFCYVENLTDKPIEFSKDDSFVEINGQQVYCNAVSLRAIEPNSESCIFFPFFNYSEVLATDFQFCFNDSISTFMEDLDIELKSVIEYANFSSTSEIKEFKFSLCYTSILDDSDDIATTDSRVNVENVDLRFSDGKLGAYRMGEQTTGNFKYTDKTNQDITNRLNEAYANWQLEHANDTYQD